MTSVHCGDCTWDPSPCIRCNYESLFKEAQVILRVLYNEGWTMGGRDYRIIYSVKKEDRLKEHRSASKRNNKKFMEYLGRRFKVNK